MSYYLVGNDDSSFLRKRTTWDLNEALKNAQNGDTIEIMNDYVYGDSKKDIYINKNVNMIGHTTQDDEGVKLPLIKGRFIFSQKAQVSIKNIAFDSSSPDRYEVWNIKEGATVVGEHIVIGSLNRSYNNTQIILSQNSELHLKNSKIGGIVSEQSEVVGENSYINSDVHFGKSFFKFVDCEMYCFQGMH